jgi:hypothetical protein
VPVCGRDETRRYATWLSAVLINREKERPAGVADTTTKRQRGGCKLSEGME